MNNKNVNETNAGLEKSIRRPAMMRIDAQKTGKRIQEICRRRNMSVKDIQKELFIGSFQAIYAWFSGKSLPSLDNLYMLSRLLEVPMDCLIVGQEEYSEDIPSVNANNVDIVVVKSRSIHNRILQYYMKLNKLVA